MNAVAVPAPATLQQSIGRAFAAIAELDSKPAAPLAGREMGTSLSVATGIAHVDGLPGAGYAEVILFPGGVQGIAFNVDANEIIVVLRGDYASLKAGDEVERTGRVMDVAIGPACLGRVIDPLGRPLEGLGLPGGSGSAGAGKRLPIERPAPAIMDRAAVDVPLQAGLMAIDALIPIGRGQRELILGDRQTGKTAIAIDAIVNQRGHDVVCVYCAICQRASAVAKLVAVQAQSITLVALTAGLFDAVALVRMAEAQVAVWTACAALPTELQLRLVGDKPMNEEDRASILARARKPLAPFVPAPAALPITP